MAMRWVFSSKIGFRLFVAIHCLGAMWYWRGFFHEFYKETLGFAARRDAPLERAAND